jgi:hypothetical protein
MDVDIAYFRWKFLENPSGSFIGYVAEEVNSGEIGAYYGVIPECWYVNGVETVIYQSCDTMTHSQHRRRGLFQKLALHCYDELRSQGKLFIIGFSGAQSTPGFIKFGWKKIFEFSNCFIPRLLCLLPAQGDLNRVTSIEDIQNIDVLLEKKSGFALRSVRSLDVVRWRYGNPRHPCVIYAYRGSKGFEGYISYYPEGDRIVLFDFNFLTAASRRGLMKHLKKVAVVGLHKGIFAFCMAGRASSAALREAGFITNPFTFGPLSERAPFIFYGSADLMSRYVTADSWYVESFDHDSF